MIKLIDTWLLRHWWEVPPSLLEKNWTNWIDSSIGWEVCCSIWFDTRFVFMDLFSALSLHVAREVAVVTDGVTILREFLVTLTLILFVLILSPGIIVVGLAVHIVQSFGCRCCRCYGCHCCCCCSCCCNSCCCHCWYCCGIYYCHCYRCCNCCFQIGGQHW